MDIDSSDTAAASTSIKKQRSPLQLLTAELDPVPRQLNPTPYEVNYQSTWATFVGNIKYLKERDQPPQSLLNEEHMELTKVFEENTQLVPTMVPEGN